MSLFNLASQGVDLQDLPEAPPPPAPPPAVSPREVTIPERLNSAFDAAAQAFDVDGDILRGIAFAESRFRPDIMDGTVRSRTGATGLMQFMPKTAAEIGIDPLNPEMSIFGAAEYLRKNLDRFGGDYQRAVAAYNWGPNRDAYDREDWHNALPEETRNYVGDVLGFAAGQARKPLPAGVAPNEGAGAGRGDAGAQLRAQMLRGQEATPAAAPTMEPVYDIMTGAQIGERPAQPADGKPSAIATELGNLRDSFFSGVDSAVAGVKTVNTAAQAAQLQRTQAELAKLEAAGQGDSEQARSLRTTIAHYTQRLPAMAASAAQAQADAQRGQAMTTRPAVAAISKAKSFGEAWEIFKTAPYDVIAGVSSQSLPSMLPALVAGVVAGPVAGAAAMGGSSAVTEAGSSLADYARDQGVDVTNGKAVEAFFRDPAKLAEAMSYAGKRAGIIGALDAASGGVAGKTLAPQIMKGVLTRQAVNLPAQMTVQAGLGAGGEAGAQLATKGKIAEPGQVFLEAAGELAGAPLEVAAFSNEVRRTVTAPRVEDQPTVPVAPVVPPAARTEPEEPATQQAPAEALASEDIARRVQALEAQQATPSTSEADAAVSRMEQLLAPSTAAAAPAASPTQEQPNADQTSETQPIQARAEEAAGPASTAVAEPAGAAPAGPEAQGQPAAAPLAPQNQPEVSRGNALEEAPPATGPAPTGAAPAPAGVDMQPAAVAAADAAAGRGAEVQAAVEPEQKALFSRSPKVSTEANVRRGSEAMNRAILDKADVNRAMYRNDLGWVDFVWGDDKKGIQHILARRTAQDGMSERAAMRLLTEDLVDAIALGETIRRTDIGKASRLVLAYGNVEAVLTRNNSTNGWLLSGYEVKKGKAGDQPADDGANRTTLTTPTRFRGSEGAASDTSVTQGPSGGTSEGIDSLAPTRTTPTPTQRSPGADDAAIVRSGQDDAPQAWEGKDVTLDVPLLGGGTARMTVDAGRALSSLDSRRDALRKLKDCLG